MYVNGQLMIICNQLPCRILKDISIVVIVTVDRLSYFLTPKAPNGFHYFRSRYDIVTIEMKYYNFQNNGTNTICWKAHLCIEFIFLQYI